MQNTALFAINIYLDYADDQTLIARYYSSSTLNRHDDFGTRPLHLQRNLLLSHDSILFPRELDQPQQCDAYGIGLGDRRNDGYEFSVRSDILHGTSWRSSWCSFW